MLEGTEDESSGSRPHRAATLNLRSGPPRLCGRSLFFDSAQEAASAGRIRSLVTGLSAEPGHYGADMMLGGLGGNKELLGDLSIGQSLRQERKNL